MVPTVTQAWNQAKKNVDYTMDLLDNKRFDYERYYRDAMDNFGARSHCRRKSTTCYCGLTMLPITGGCVSGSTGRPPACLQRPKRSIQPAIRKSTSGRIRKLNWQRLRCSRNPRSGPMSRSFDPSTRRPLSGIPSSTAKRHHVRR